MYQFVAMAVLAVGGAVAGAVWKARSKDKQFLEQLKSLHPKDGPLPVKEAIIIAGSTNGSKKQQEAVTP